MNEQLERGGLSSSSAPSGPLAAVGPGASSHPTGPAQRSSSAPTPRARRIGFATATLATLGTLAIAIAAAGGLGAAGVATTGVPAGVTTAAATQAVAQPSPTEQVVVDTVYVNAPAPTPQPPLVVASKVKATPRPPIRVVKIVPSTGGGEGGGEAETGGGDD